MIWVEYEVWGYKNASSASCLSLPFHKHRPLTSSSYIPKRPTTKKNMKTTPLFLLLVPTLAARLKARQAPPPNQTIIVNAQTSGNGCPQGTVSTNFSPDRTIVTFGFDSFQTYIGPGTAPADHSKNCQIHLTLDCMRQPQLFIP
jgi:hypothetical protein